MKDASRSLIIIILINLFAVVSAADVLESGWPSVVRGTCDDQDAAWWSSDEAIRIAENVLLYQRDIGGWPKNTDMHLVLSQSQINSLIAIKPTNQDCTIDNGAVNYELTYLSKVYAAISIDSVKTKIETGFLKGVQYLIDAQYDNGGWPQFYPLRGGYSNHITYNDDAMVHAMEILRHIYQKDSEFSITVDDTMAGQAKAAFDKGLECILKTQYIQHGSYTVWCAQHHYETMEPVMARSYELASLSGGESSGIIDLLISIVDPAPEILRAVYSAAKWYDENRVTGKRIESYTNSDGLWDIRVVEDPEASDMWARFYTLEDNRPFFCSRDGIKRYTLAEISYERRTNYSWYNTSGFGVLAAYDAWPSKFKNTILASPVAGSEFLDVDTIRVFAFSNKNAGHVFQQTDLLVDGAVITNFTSQELDTNLSGLGVGEHTIVINSIYADDYTETDSTTIQILQSYALEVNSGSGDGHYVEGTVVKIIADAPPEGMVFDQWSGDTAYVQSHDRSTSYITIPAGDVNVTALYKVETGSFFETQKAEFTNIVCYPNPVRDVLNIDLSNTGDVLIEIFDMQSRKVFSEKKEEGSRKIHMGDLPPGIYMIHISDTSRSRFTGKIFVQP